LKRISRREFLKKAAAVSATAAVASQIDWAGMALRFLVPVDVSNPLEYYPNRDWESIYRNQYRYDSSFTFVCAPNDTHNCRLRAYVRNSIIVRVEQAYDVADYTDLQGNKANAIWHPRGCLKGYTIMRRIYGPYRIKYPMIRTGWKKWVEDNFPDPNLPANQSAYFQRGLDTWTRVNWDEAFTLAARALLHITEKYSGTSGAQLLRDQGYPSLMIDGLDDTGSPMH